MGNLILLIGGYGLGQGGVFLAQTWLISRGQLGLVADFGINFYVATLAIMLVDFGSTAVLARETAAFQHARSVTPAPGSPAVPDLWADFWAIFPARAGMAVAVIIAGAMTVAFTGDAFARAYAVWAWPAVIVWTLNATGILDGLRLSGMNGLAGSLPFVISGSALALVADQPPAVAGAVLGAALSTGYLLAMAGQALALSRAGHAPRWDRPTRQAIIQSARSGFAALLSILPGQIYFRFQILLAGLFLGEAGVALLLYGKQVATGFSQIIGFLRRIEFPDLVQRLHRNARGRVRIILVSQWLGTSVAAVCAISVVVVGLSVAAMTSGTTADAAIAAAMFGPAIFSGALSLTFIQGLIALKAYRAAAVIMVASVAITLAGILAVSSVASLAVFAAADVVLNAIAITLAVMFLRSPARALMAVGETVADR